MWSSGKMSLSLISGNTQKRHECGRADPGPTLCLDNTAEMTLMTGMQVSQTLRSRVQESWPYNSSAMRWPGRGVTGFGRVVWDDSSPGTVRKLDLRNHESSEVSLTLTCCRTWEIRPCTSPVQCSRASPGCRVTSKPASSVRVWEN